MLRAQSLPEFFKLANPKLLTLLCLAFPREMLVKSLP